MKEIKTTPQPMTATAVLDIRFPNRPFITNPAAGNSGINQIRSRKFMLPLPLHQIDLVDVHRFLVLEHRDHDPKPDRGFRCSHCNDKDSEDLTGNLLEPV